MEEISLTKISKTGWKVMYKDETSVFVHLMTNDTKNIYGCPICEGNINPGTEMWHIQAKGGLFPTIFIHRACRMDVNEQKVPAEKTISKIIDSWKKACRLKFWFDWEIKKWTHYQEKV